MDLLDDIQFMLSRREDFVLAVILSRQGAAPRSAGTRMILRRDGGTMGSIGGGSLEAEVQRMANEVFHSGAGCTRRFDLTPEETDRIGMICGGRVEILLHLMDSSLDTYPGLYEQLSRELEACGTACLITQIPQDFAPYAELPQILLNRWGSILACAGFQGESSARCERILESVHQASGSLPRCVCIPIGQERFLVERLEASKTVFIFGAGHIARELAPLTKQVGFRTIVLDDRLDFADPQRFINADSVIALSSFDQAFHQLCISCSSYVVILTRGHAHDKTVLRQALQSQAGYIGMIGSRRKRDAIYHALAQEGFSPQDLARVHSPIGLTIGAETPEEIAVSIVAELIQVRSLQGLCSLEGSMEAVVQPECPSRS